MPVPAPNLYPEFNIVRLSHIELGVTDLRSSTFFYSEILGLQVTLGISTLIFYIPIPIAAAHQICAVALLSASLYVSHCFKNSI